MKASEAKMLEFLKKSPQFVIPIYQRTYSCTEWECRQFVDVVPQAKRLRLSLNISIHEIDDPFGLCKDVSGLERWGNGDVEVSLSAYDEIPYVIGLVRQCFERQMGSGTQALE